MIFSMIVILLACAVYGLLHSLLAARPAKELAARWFGSAAERYYRLFYNFVGVVTFLPLLLLAWRLPDVRLYAIPLPWLALTLAIQASAGLGLLAGVRQTGAAAFLGLGVFLPGRAAPPEEGRFVTGGLYRWVRHPLYTCGLAIVWLVPVMTANLMALALGLTVYILIGIHFEERKLLREFGAAYAEYQKQVPALIPRWRRKQDADFHG